MGAHEQSVRIAVGGDHIAGTLVRPTTLLPGMLFVHGWRGSQKQYLMRAREIAALGCICLAIDLRGHAESSAQRHEVTREDSLQDITASYDFLAQADAVDESAVGVVGSSYGAYLAAILTSMRPVKWLALRVPALYKDEDWNVPKEELDRGEIERYRSGFHETTANRALRACAEYTGDVLIVASERDEIIPPAVIASYRAAFRKVRSLTFRVLETADHGLSEERSQQAYTSVLLNWATEMVLGSREQGSAAAAVQGHIRPSPRRRPPRPA